jgi:hypothetical protein
MNSKAVISICTASLLIVSILFYVSIINDVRCEVNSVYEGWMLRTIDDGCYISLFTLNEEVFWIIERDVVLKLTLGEISEIPEVISLDSNAVSIIRRYFPDDLHVRFYVTDVVLSEYVEGGLDPVLSSSLNTRSNMLEGAISYDLKLEVLVAESNFTVSRVLNIRAIHPARMYSLILLLNKFNEQLGNTVKSHSLVNTSIQALAGKVIAFLESFSESNLRNKYFEFNVDLDISISRVEDNLYHVYIHISKVVFSDALYRIRYMGLNSLASISRRNYGLQYVTNGSNVEVGLLNIKYSYP